MYVLHLFSQSPPSGSITGGEHEKKELVIQLTCILYRYCLTSLVILPRYNLFRPCISPLRCRCLLLHLALSFMFLRTSHLPTVSATYLSEEGVVKAHDDGQSDSSPSRSDDLLVLEPDTHVPGQMPQAVEAVEEEGESEESLQSDLDSRGPSSNCRHHGLCLKVPSSVRSDQVGDAEDIEGSGEDDASESVERRGVPGDLRSVDGQVGGDGAVDALFRKDFGCFGLRGVLGCCESTLYIVSIHRRIGIGGAGGASKLDAAMTYLRWAMRPAGCILRLGAAALRRPSWNIR
jgi:hypothetical protein